MFIGGDVLTRPTASYAFATLAGVLVVMPVAAAFGSIVAILPNLFGTALLAWAGRGNVGIRFWPVWAMAGAGLGWAIDWTAALTGGTGARSHVRAGRHPLRADLPMGHALVRLGCPTAIDSAIGPRSLPSIGSSA